MRAYLSVYFRYLQLVLIYHFHLHENYSRMYVRIRLLRKICIHSMLIRGDFYYVAKDLGDAEYFFLRFCMSVQKELQMIEILIHLLLIVTISLKMTLKPPFRQKLF